LFPGLFSIPRPITTSDVPVIVAASILSTYEFPILPITKVSAPLDVEKKGVKLFKAIGGQQIVRLVLESKPSDYNKLLWSPCTTSSMWLGALEFDESLDRLLKVFELTGFGDARVNAHAPPHALVTLDEVVSLYRERKLKCKLEVEKVASRAVFVDPDAKLMEAMRVMCDKRIRRLFLHGQEGVFVSDRNILAFLFSPKALAVAKDAPELWTDVDISSIPSMKASLVSPRDRVEDVGRMLEPGHDVFVLSENDSLVSRWDLVIKPWKANKLYLAT
jgi:CBS domain-containing protein